MTKKELLKKLGCSQDILSYLDPSSSDCAFEIPDYDSLFEVEPIAVTQIDVDLNKIIIAGNRGLCEQGAAANTYYATAS